MTSTLIPIRLKESYGNKLVGSSPVVTKTAGFRDGFWTFQRYIGRTNHVLVVVLITLKMPVGRPPVTTPRHGLLFTTHLYRPHSSSSRHPIDSSSSSSRHPSSIPGLQPQESTAPRTPNTRRGFHMACVGVKGESRCRSKRQTLPRPSRPSAMPAKRAPRVLVPPLSLSLRGISSNRSNNSAALACRGINRRVPYESPHFK